MADKRIVINYDLWKRGITPSGFVGLENSYLVDPGVSGILKASNSTSKQSNSSGDDEVVGSILLFLRDSVNDDLYAITDENKGGVYRSTDGGDTWAKLDTSSGTNSACHGAAIWKGFMFLFNGAAVDVYGTLPTFTLIDADWPSANGVIATGSDDSAYHITLHSEDDALYVGHENIISKIEENVGQTFAPGTSASYTITKTALDLPSGERVRTMNDLGNRMLIGTWRDTATPSAKIYPWDRISSSFDRPIILPEKGVRSSLVLGNLMYFVAGSGGKLYVTDGQTVQLVAELPDEFTGNFPSIDSKPAGMIYDKGKVLIAYSSTVLTSTAVWSWDLQLKKWNIEYTISTLPGVGTANISALYPSQGSLGLLLGWFDSGDWGIDQVVSDQYSAHNSYIETPMYQVGTKNNPYTFSLLEVNLAKNISSSGIRVAYRTVHTGSYTTIDTFSTDGVSSFRKEIGNLINIEKIQFKISFTGSPSPELMSVIIY